MEKRIEELKDLATQYNQIITNKGLPVNSKITKDKFIAQKDKIDKKDELIKVIIKKIHEL